MTKRHLAVLVFVLAVLATAAEAQLTNTTSTQPSCKSGSTYWGRITYYSNWTYTDAYGAHLFNGTSWQINGSPAICRDPLSGGFTSNSTDGLGYVLKTNGGNGTITIPTITSGYVNPKYVIVGVTYAPPGPSSFVNYSNSTLVGTETSLNSSFANGVTLTVKVSAGIGGWLNGSVSAISSTSYTQESDSSSSVTVSKQTTQSNQTPGPADPYVGINHDYDIIWLWLNPVTHLATFKNTGTGTTAVQWRGYGFSTMDQPAMDIYPVYVGWLNGDLPMTPSQSAPLQRAWAAGQIWPTGQGPGLTTTDYQNIVKVDPYWQCTPTPSVCPTAVDPVRFTLTSNQDFIYQQPPPGGQPSTQTYSDTNTLTTSQGQGSKYTFSQMFGLEQTFGGSAFGVSLTTTLTQASTLTWTHEWQHKLNQTNSSTASLSITGPPCVVVGGVCNPAYHKSTQFDLYQDNLYGTFFFNPVN